MRILDANASGSTAQSWAKYAVYQIDLPDRITKKQRYNYLYIYSLKEHGIPIQSYRGPAYNEALLVYMKLKQIMKITT